MALAEIELARVRRVMHDAVTAGRNALSRDLQNARAHEMLAWVLRYARRYPPWRGVISQRRDGRSR
jgi:hypothetical protein